MTLNIGDQLTILQPPGNLSPGQPIPNWLTSTASPTLVVADDQGRPGQVTTALSNFTLVLAPSSAPVTQEFGLVSSVALVPVSATNSAPRTRITISKPLLNCYDRTATTVNANVGIATGGSPVTELLGSGNAQTPNQSFTLKQTPLTYIQAATPTGGQSSLPGQCQRRGMDRRQLALQPVPIGAGLRRHEPAERRGGSRLWRRRRGRDAAHRPKQHHRQLPRRYRLGGNVDAGQITTLVDRPLGVSGVSNPDARHRRTGCADGLQAFAPTPRSPCSRLGRAVSIDDYQNLAASFAGIAQAYALWIPNGVNRGVFVTVAASDGQALPPGNLTLANLDRRPPELRQPQRSRASPELPRNPLRSRSRHRLRARL